MSYNVTNPLGIYFEAVDAGDFDAATQTFSEDCVYARPPVPTGVTPRRGGLELMFGKEAVRTFLGLRGKIPLTHQIHSTTVDRRQCFVEGTAKFSGQSGAAASIFIAHADLDEQGLISRFLALAVAVDTETIERIQSPGQGGGTGNEGSELLH